MLEKVSKILLVRADRIGDVVLTTPAITAIRKRYPKAKIVACINKSVENVLDANPDLDQLLLFHKKQYGGVWGFFRLYRAIRKERFEVVVCFQSTFRLSFAIFLSFIPYRIGPLSKWWSWLFYNMGIRQNRSNVEMHEADYNIQLLRDLGISVSHTHEKTQVYVKEKYKEVAKTFFADRGIQKKYKTIAIHPGMGNSALNWPEEYYVQLARALCKEYNIIITGGPTEKDLVDRVLQKISQKQSYDMDLPILTQYVGKGALGEFAAILDQCDGVVAPSTGPMHLAIALKKKVLTFFSPIQVQSGVRWGPYIKNFGTQLGVSPDDQASILVPDVNCGEIFKCALTACVYYPCMPRVSVKSAELQLRTLLEGKEVQ